MSDSNRLLIAAAAIGLIACALIWGVIGVGLLTSDPERAEAYRESQDHRGGYQRQSDRSVIALSEQECAKAHEQTDNGTYDAAQRDLCAQFIAAAAARQSAKYAQAQTWIGVFGFVSVIVGLVLNWVATLAATEAAQQTRRSVQAVMDTERAWLLFDDAMLEDHLKAAGALLGPHPQAKIVIRNVGKSVAWITRARCRIVNLKRGEYLPPAPEYADWPFDFETRVEMLPDRTFRTETNSVLDWDQTDVDAFSWARTRLVIYGLIEYEDAYGRPHQTQFGRSWYFPRLVGTLEELNAEAYWSAQGLNAYNYQT